MGDAAVLELLGQMPPPQLGHRGIGRCEHVVDLLQEELRLDQAEALETFAIGEIPLQRPFREEALEVAAPLFGLRLLNLAQSRMSHALRIMQRRGEVRVKRPVFRHWFGDDLPPLLVRRRPHARRPHEREPGVLLDQHDQAIHGRLQRTIPRLPRLRATVLSRLLRVLLARRGHRETERRERRQPRARRHSEIP